MSGMRAVIMQPAIATTTAASGELRLVWVSQKRDVSHLTTVG
jgi:hypothetical protein